MRSGDSGTIFKISSRIDNYVASLVLRGEENRLFIYTFRPFILIMDLISIFDLFHAEREANYRVGEAIAQYSGAYTK